MKLPFAGLLFFLLGVTTVSASEFVVTEVERPYDIVEFESDLTTKQVYLGELDNFPIMYEVTADEPFTFTAQVRQLYQPSADPLGFSLIVIRENDQERGVTEVARLRPDKDDWTRVKDRVLGMTFWESEVLMTDVEPGIYRMEISTPENLGKYLLTIGDHDQFSGYFEMLGNVRTTQKFFGLSFLSMLTSSYVYYPLGVFLLLFMIHRTWKYRKTIAYVD